MEITFTNPSYLWFLLVLPLVIVSHFFSLKVSRGKTIKFANFEALSRVSDAKRISRNWFLLLLRTIMITLIILALASPILWYFGSSSDIDYIIAVDTSGSMFAEDFVPSRIEAAKYSASLFVESIASTTNIGVVSFAGNTFVEQRLTDDTKAARDKINALNIRYSSGTAIGDAIITSTNLFNKITTKSKVIVLLTDGQNTVGTPLESAIEYAKTEGIIVYTLGVGTKEGAKFGALETISKLDEESLKRIAEETGGSYYFTGDQQQLINAFKDITSKQRKTIPLKLSFPMMVLILILLALEWGFVNTIYKISP